MSAQAVVIVFSMAGCGACESYLPRFDRLVLPYEQAGLPVYRYDADDERPEVQQLVTRLRVSATPTTFVLRRGPGEIRQEGDLDDREIKQLLDTAARLNGMVR